MARTTAHLRHRIDERAISAGTTMRFALLVILLLVSSGSMMIMGSEIGRSNSKEVVNWYGCHLAAGVDPNRIDDLATNLGALLYADTLDACLARYAPEPPWQLNLVWPALTLVASAVLFRVLPAWKARRSRVVPLEAVDHTGEIRRTLDDLAATAGLARMPRIVVDPATASTGAVVFGSNRRPTVCLHGGLLARRSGDPEGFRAVLLHEFAHVRNGDVTLTYATVAVWRVFVALVLLPYLVWCATVIPTSYKSPFWAGQQPFVARAFVLPVFLTVLVYLARSDVLRMREVYADLAAVRWGAGPRGWAVATPEVPESGLKRRLAPFVELWRTHPRWDLRRRAMDDPAALFGIRALPMFLTGAAASMISAQTASSLGPNTGSGGQAFLMALPAATVVAGVAGVALWRAVAHALLTGRRVPSGVRAGLWLGAGMAVGELAMYRVAVARWLPAHVEALGAAVAVGALFAWWTTQCSHLWFRAWPRRAKGPAVLLVMAAGSLLLTAWFVWWQIHGTHLASGWIDMTAAREATELTFPGPTAAHQGMVFALAVWFDVFSGLDQPVVLAAVCALWVVPLPAWTTGSATGVRRRAGEAPDGSMEAEPRTALPTLPKLRGVLLVSMLGGVACWVGAAIAKAYMHTWQPPSGQRGGLYSVSLAAWVLVVLVTVSAVAGAVASSRVRRYRLPITLMTAEISALIGLFGFLMLLSVDGCVRPLSTLASHCHWVPSGAWSMVGPMLLGPVLVSTALLAAVAASVVSAVDRMRGAGLPRAASVRPPDSRRQLHARHAAVSAICAVAVAATVSAATVGLRHKPSNGAFDRQAQDHAYAKIPRAEGSSAVIRRAQLEYWLNFGGRDLMRRSADAHDRLGTALNRAADAGGRVERSTFDPVCSEFDQLATDAGRYFPIPDARADSQWQKYMTQVREGSRDCLRSFAEDDEKRFMASINELTDALAALTAMGFRFDEIRAAADH
ncbi:M48 family metallopeptidase [Streptomyces sp. NPDC059989]|uniref:M48 family metallopeptidase n=1 Tax=Streptomyces sp. NPDC059989 TaxID=3347026 RepID=UPI0036989C10